MTCRRGTVAIVVPLSLLLGIGALGWGLMRIAIAGKASRDVGAVVIVLIAGILLSVGLWLLGSLL